jgi:hypothetical protein
MIEYVIKFLKSISFTITSAHIELLPHFIIGGIFITLIAFAVRKSFGALVVVLGVLITYVYFADYIYQLI